MTEQEMREKVIDDLVSCLDDSVAAVVPRDTVTAALALLKAQEPRLVTREDFQQAPAYDGVLPCWKESRSKTRRNGWAAIVYGKALQDMEAGVARYWTGVPTEEQRREMAWPQM